MRRIPYIFCIVLAMLAAACSEEVTPTYSVGAADSAITLRASISQQARPLRAIDDNHGEHIVFEPYMTKAVLRMDGQRSDGWWRRRTTATMTDFVGYSETSKHNDVNMDPMLYWDDFHTADPANTAGRAYGLEIYGAAVANYLNGEGKAGFLPDNTDANGNNLKAMLESGDWTRLHWTLPLNQSDGTTITNSDLLTTNNVTKGKDGTLKFDDVTGKSGNTPSNLLEFTHAMTRITVELTAGKGFTPNGSGQPTFQDVPSVTLLGFPYVGLVDIIHKTSTPTATDFADGSTPAKGNILCHVSMGGGSHTATLTALVYPGCAFADATNVLSVKADGNEYLVTAKKINEAMTAAGLTTTLQQGTNYVFQVTVNKTSVDVTATTKDWDNIEAANEAPIINFDKCYGQDGAAFTETFSLYRSTNKMAGPYTGNSDQAVISYDAEHSRYVMTPQLYWPDHKTHYFFRAIWPKVGSATGPAAAQIDGGKRILVQNEPYTAGQYPSELRLGLPRKADGTPDETCKKTGEGHGVEGICATDAPDGSTHDADGKIHLNFQYAMSQVIVQLKTNADVSSTNRVTFNEHTKVEILNGYTAGALMLGDGSSDFTGKTPATYIMANDNSLGVPAKYENYRDAIVPQALTNASGDLAFRITVSEDGGVTSDAYETVLGIKSIQVNEGGVLKTIDAWKPGKKYVYTLTITKTGVTVTATIADWDTVTADTPIWM